MDELRRTLQRKERRRTRLARTLAAVSLIVGAALLTSALIAGALTRSARPPQASAAGSLTVAAESQATTVTPSSEPALPDASPAAGSSQTPSAPTTQVAPKPAAAPRKSQPAATKPRVTSTPSKASTAPQRFRIAIGALGYEPSVISARVGRLITLTVGKGDGCAAGFEMPQLGVHADNSSGPVRVRLGKLKAGSYTYTCSMGMVSGTLRVY